MSIQSKIEECFSKLSPSWFARIRSEFEEHPFYIPMEEKISTTIFEGEIEIHVNVNLFDYCWNNIVNYYASRGPIEEEDRYEADAEEITRPIIDVLETTINSLQSLAEKYQIIKTANAAIVERRTLKTEDEQYRLLLYVSDKLLKVIGSNFSDICILAEDILDFSVRLKIDINLNELAILIVLLVPCRNFQHSKSASKGRETLSGPIFHIKTTQLVNIKFQDL